MTSAIFMINPSVLWEITATRLSKTTWCPKSITATHEERNHVKNNDMKTTQFICIHTITISPAQRRWIKTLHVTAIYVIISTPRSHVYKSDCRNEFQVHTVLKTGHSNDRIQKTDSLYAWYRNSTNYMLTLLVSGLSQLINKNRTHSSIRK